MKTYLFTYSLAVLFSMGLMPLVILWARKLQLIDVPNVRKVHTSPIARVGGIAIFISTMLTFLPMLGLQNTIGENFRDRGIEISVLLIGATLMFVVGLYDDFKGLRARTKLGLQFLSASMVCSAGIYIKQFTIRDLCVIDLGWLGYLISIFWIIGITNAMNLIDGLDGLAGGISAIACGVMAVLSVWQHNTLLAVIMLSLLGSLTGFLCFNFHPAKIFMGDCGSLFLGFTIATTSILTATKSEALMGLGLPVLVLGIPIFDTFFTMLRRYLERRGIMSPDRSHFHHRLLELGIGQRQVAVLAYIVTLLITGLGCFMIATRGALSVIILLCCLILLLLVFRVIGAVRLRDILEGISSRTELNHQKFMERKLFEEAQLYFRNADTIEDWWKCMCKAAKALDFARLSLEFACKEERIRTWYWKNKQKGTMNSSQNKLQIIVPLVNHEQIQTCKIHIDIITRGSLEYACRRIALFSRLADENRIENFKEGHKKIEVTHSENIKASKSETELFEDLLSPLTSNSTVFATTQPGKDSRVTSF